MKSGVMSALSSNTKAETLPEWEKKHLILYLDRSGWTTLAMDCRILEIFPPVRYCFMPFIIHKHAHGFWIWLAQPLGTKKNPVCSSDWADIWVIIIDNQSDGLTIFPILLDLKSDLELCWEFLQFTCWSMDFNDTAFVVVEISVIPSECFHDTFTGRVFIFIDFRLGLLRILRATQSSNPDERELLNVSSTTRPLQHRNATTRV